MWGHKERLDKSFKNKSDPQSQALGYISREALEALYEKTSILIITGLYRERLKECFMERSDLRIKVN